MFIRFVWFIRVGSCGRWVHSGSFGSFELYPAVVRFFRFVRARQVSRRVHSRSFGSFERAHMFVDIIWFVWLQRLSGSFGFVWLIRACTRGCRVDSGSFGSFGSALRVISRCATEPSGSFRHALGVIMFFRDCLVHSVALRGLSRVRSGAPEVYRPVAQRGRRVNSGMPRW